MDSKYSYLYKKAREYCSYVYELYATHYKKKPVRYNCRWIDQSLYYSSQYIRAQGITRIYQKKGIDGVSLVVLFITKGKDMPEDLNEKKAREIAERVEDCTRYQALIEEAKKGLNKILERYHNVDECSEIAKQTLEKLEGLDDKAKDAVGGGG